MTNREPSMLKQICSSFWDILAGGIVSLIEADHDEIPVKDFFLCDCELIPLF